MTRNWYRGPVSDWVRSAIIGPLLAFALWLSLYVQNQNEPAFKTVPGGIAYAQQIPWVEGLLTSLPYGIAFIPIIVLCIRWYFAGGPLPPSLTNRPYILYAKGCAILQAIGGLTAWSLYGYTFVSGASMEQTIQGLPTVTLYPIALALSVGVLVGLAGTIVFMYLDARYVGERRLLDVLDTPNLLLYVPFFGIQFAGIPTLVAVWYYDSRRDTATVDRVSYHA